MKYAMSDGRIFTSYLPNCELNTELQKAFGTSDIHAYRQYLQDNAEKIIKESTNTKDVCKI